MDTESKEMKSQDEELKDGKSIQFEFETIENK